MAKPKAFVLPPPAPKTSGYTSPIPHLIAAVNNPDDHGQDYQGQVGTNVVAIGNATITSVTPDPTGFGEMIIYTLTSGNAKYTQIYVGHAQPVAGLHKGQTVAQGDAVATLVPAGTIPGSNATQDGWAEIGIADNGQPKYAKGIVGGAEFKKVLGLKLTPTESAASSTYQSTITAQTQAGSPGYIAATTDIGVIKAQAVAAAKATAHVSDPWVTVLRDKAGNATGFGEAYGEKPPAGVLTIGGQPATKALLNSTWGATYDSVWQAYTGKVATANDIEQVLEQGLSSYALKDKLAAQPGFTSSPIYKQNAPSYQGVAKTILGGSAPKTLVSKAIANGWDQTAFADALRQTPGYLKGPEFKTNVAQMTTTFQNIYGTADDTAQQSIKEAAAKGWTTDQFGQYLRSQPQYKTSVEYQSHALNFLDALGLTLGARSTLTPTPAANVPTGGTAVPNAKVVPGKPTPLNPELSLTPKLGGNASITGAPA